MFPENSNRLDTEPIDIFLANANTPYFHNAFPPDVITHHPSHEHEKAPARNHIRVLVSILMVVILMVTVSYAAVQPWLHQENREGTQRRVEGAITGVSAVNTSCRYAPRITVEGALPPTRVLCICGRVGRNNRDAPGYMLLLRSEDGATLGQMSMPGRFGGEFCYRMHLTSELQDGHYHIDLLLQSTSSQIDTFRFTIQSSRSL
jgi:hypothetical protein